jgi:Flp pilus assembly protein TadD
LLAFNLFDCHTAPMKNIALFLVLLAGCSSGASASKETTDALLNQARASIQAEDNSSALAALNQLLALDAEHAEALTLRGSLYQQSGEYAKAIEDYNKAIPLDPHSAKAAGALAWLLATCQEDSIRNGKRAVQVANIALMRGHDDWHNLDALAAALAESGDFEQAVKRQSALLLNPPPEKAAELQLRLESYKAGNPWRE